MAITKPAVRDAWADGAVSSADIVDPGNTYVAAGWLESSTPPPRQYFNWLLNYLGNAVAYFMRRGVADYDAAETYQVGDVVLSDTGMLMQSLAANQSGHLPSTSTAYWASLKNYATTGQMTNAIATALLPYSTSASVAAALASYVTSATLSATLAAYVTGANLASTLAGYETTTALTTRLASYATTASLSAYKTVAAFNTAIAAYATTASLTAAVAPLATSASVTAAIATAEAYANGSSTQATQGKIKLPGGLIFQWGTIAGVTPAGEVENIVSNLPYPNANTFFVMAIANGGSPIFVQSWSASQFTWGTGYTGGRATSALFVFAIGN
jgi:hypothetical protein